MARIRTIKPEFPQSESMGRVSRDARLCFIMLWTIADDSGRLRGNSRMLASLLFPYDDDAKKHIDAWLTELENECCVIRYTAGGDSYIQITGWASHQKIDKPSVSKLPAPPDDSEKTREDSAKVREVSSEDLRTKDQGPKEGSTRASRIPPDFEPAPEPEAERGIDRATELANFRDYWTAKSGREATKLDWQATWRQWARKSRRNPADVARTVTTPMDPRADAALRKLDADKALTSPPSAEMRARMAAVRQGAHA
jgi:hypothetical protein